MSNLLGKSIFLVVISLFISAGFGNEVMTDRCSADVAIVPDYNARPDAFGTIILTRGLNGWSNWTPPFKVSLRGGGKLKRGYIRWWCNSTIGNWMDPGTWRPNIDYGKTVLCAVNTVAYVYGGREEEGKKALETCSGAVKGVGSSAWNGWTPERSRCNNRSTKIRARLGPNRLLQIECMGHDHSNVESELLNYFSVQDQTSLSQAELDEAVKKAKEAVEEALKDAGY